MKDRRIKGLIIIMAFCAAVFVTPIANAYTIPYNIGTLESFLADANYFNGYDTTLIASKDFSDTWQYTAIASEAANVNVTKDPLSTSAVTFTNSNTTNWGLWETVNFNSENVYFYDVTTSFGPFSLDSYASGSYFKLYQLTADSELLDYLNHSITLSKGTFILGFNENGSTDSDYDDLIIALQPVQQQVPEPATMLLLGLGLVGLAGVRKFKK